MIFVNSVRYHNGNEKKYNAKINLTSIIKTKQNKLILSEELKFNASAVARSIRS